jgi:formate hydrogenlyase subunit 4
VILRALHVATLVVMPILLVGLINRTKSWWAGRKGPPVIQLAYDVRRLARKSSVYSETTTPLFRIAPYVFLATSLGSALLVPVLGASSFASFDYDFVWFAHVWALGRLSIMLAALDTGSAFEGMGASREAVFSAVLEPVFFLVAGALCFMGDVHTFEAALTLRPQPGAQMAVTATAVIALLILLTVESARMPVDDPTTHLELTMVHEVMVLDHSGPELAAIQVGAALKLFLGASVVATLHNPWSGQLSVSSVFVQLALCAAVAVTVGTVESLVARLKLRAVPQYIALALLAGTVGLLATAWTAGGH